MAAASTRDPEPAEFASVVLYHKDTLGKNGERSTKADWEIVTITRARPRCRLRSCQPIKGASPQMSPARRPTTRVATRRRRALGR